jgi:hypothetical protein
MPSPCSLPLGAVRSHHATEVRALRPSPLALAAGESMKIEGASRRSAAPGSQKVGDAEYGGDLCALQQSLSARTKERIHGPLATMRIAASLSPIRPSPEVHERPTTSKRPKAKESESPTSRAGSSAISACAMLCITASCHARRSLQLQQSTHFFCAAMSAVPRTAANPSFNLTRSGLRPPRAS